MTNRELFAVVGGWSLISATLAAGVAKHNADIQCEIVPSQPPADCSLGSALRNRGLPVECRQS